MEDRLTHNAMMDVLTGLSNRRALAEHLQREWARMQRGGQVLSLIMIDLDHFKDVNDQHGHSAGDRMLKEVAGALAGQCRQTDIPCRYGGEEFAVLVSNAPCGVAALLAERCRQAVGTIRVHEDGSDVGITASFGVADTSDAESIEDLIEMADRALYEAKQDGRNTVRAHHHPAVA